MCCPDMSGHVRTCPCTCYVHIPRPKRSETLNPGRARAWLPRSDDELPRRIEHRNHRTPSAYDGYSRKNRALSLDSSLTRSTRAPNRTARDPTARVPCPACGKSRGHRLQPSIPGLQLVLMACLRISCARDPTFCPRSRAPPVATSPPGVRRHTPRTTRTRPRHVKIPIRRSTSFLKSGGTRAENPVDESSVKSSCDFVSTRPNAHRRPETTPISTYDKLAQNE